ncbi:hypothetical protein C0991_005888 [Blastosporella zonata]|nr:hypothetical protein C0991_005888 [Blastosporella zonata]
MPTLRTGVFAFVTFAAVIVLALCAHVTNTTTTLLGGYFAFAALGIATSVLAILTLPVMLVVDNMRKGAFTSMILVEQSILPPAANLAPFKHLRISRGLLVRTSHQLPSNERVSRIYIPVFGYLVALVTFSIMLANRGYNRVWYQSVKETEFNAPPVNVAPITVPTQQYIPPQDTGVYPPQATPVPGWAGTPQPAPVSTPYPQA